MRERQSWLQMRKMKAKVPRGRAKPANLSVRELTGQPDQQSDERPRGGSAPAHPGSAQQREINVSRVRRFSARLAWMVLGVLMTAPLAPAFGQNLDAGKPASQIFSEVCANCHRSPREFRSNPGASFLREHYTTGSEMASTMAAYLSGAGSDPRGAAQPKRQPNPAATAPGGSSATARDAPATDTSRDPRRGQQTGDQRADPRTDPKTDPKTDTKPLQGASGPTRARPGSARAETTAEVKPPAPPVPARPVLEEFEE
jgi:hypothetical protein